MIKILFLFDFILFSVFTFTSAFGLSLPLPLSLSLLSVPVDETVVGNIGIDLIIFEMDFADMHKTLEENEHDLFWAGWGADFPDPLNFYMLLYTNNSLLDFGGENITNYSNLKFDKLFEGFTGNNIITLEHLISKEAPLVPAFNPKSLILDHQWLHRDTPHAFVNTPWSDYKVNSQVRAQYIEKENLVPKHYLYFLLILIGLYYLRNKTRG